MPILNCDVAETIKTYLDSPGWQPMWIEGDALQRLGEIPAASVDMCMTSPPYWGKREYQSGGIGLERTHDEYVESLLAVFREVKRVLKPSGSFWLNLGDSYLQKRLLGIPWRVALRLSDCEGWILRNNVIWHKVKGGPDNTPDRLRNVHEQLFHFVKDANAYYFNADAIRSNPKQTKVVNGAVVSSTGVSGVRYRRQIELSTALNESEKRAALVDLASNLERLVRGEVADFRMIIRGQQRTTHSSSERVSGRAKELNDKGYYFLFYDPRGSKPGDVWDILPEDTQKRDGHFAPYPEDLCRIPVLATSPVGGVVLDPFCGTGTTMRVAQLLERKSIGIDIARTYLETAEERCWQLL